MAGATVDTTTPQILSNKTLDDTTMSGPPWTYQIARGLVPGVVAWGKIGYSPASAATQTTVWAGGTEYVWPVAEQQMEVRSSDNTNDKAGGTGALTVWIKYLTAAGVEKTETITLNGTTNVNTAGTDIYRINAFRVATTGSTGKSAGIIDIRNLTDHTTVYSRILAGYTRARNSVYSVPGGKTLYISSIAYSAAYSASGKRVMFTAHATWDSDRAAALTRGVMFSPYSEVQLVDGAYTKELEIPTKLPQNTDLKISIIGETSAICTSILRGWLE
jgi:hypothetical protein